MSCGGIQCPGPSSSMPRWTSSPHRSSIGDDSWLLPLWFQDLDMMCDKWFWKDGTACFGKAFACEAILVTVLDSESYLFDGDGFDYVKYTLIRNIRTQQRSLKVVLVLACTWTYSSRHGIR